MKVAYVAGPYRAKTINGIWCNIERAKLLAADLWKMGYAVICPHANTAFMDGATTSNQADDSHVWLKGDLEILKRCDCIVMIPGWEQSEGATAEMQYACAHDIPVFIWPKHAEELQMFRDLRGEG